MFADTAPTEYVYTISEEQQKQILQEHFNLFYQTLSSNSLVSSAAFETSLGLWRCISGISYSYHNAIMGCPIGINDVDQCIDDQVTFFNDTPFVWFVDEKNYGELPEKLIQHGFQHLGEFKGVIGILERPVPPPSLPQDCQLELVRDQASMDAFGELVCTTFGIDGEENKRLYKIALWNAAKSKNPEMNHWIAKRQGKIVSTLSTMIKDGVVSFWNSASLPELRRQGISTALRRFALQDAVAKGCRIGISYLVPENPAFNICSKLGYQTRWSFSAFLSPNCSNEEKLLISYSH